MSSYSPNLYASLNTKYLWKVPIPQILKKYGKRMKLGLDKAPRCTTDVYIAKDSHINTRPLIWLAHIIFSKNGPQMKETQVTSAEDIRAVLEEEMLSFGVGLELVANKWNTSCHNDYIYVNFKKL